MLGMYFHCSAPLIVAVSAAAMSWLLSIATREYSYIDRLWSILPPVYAWLFAWQGGWRQRSVLAALLVSAWGARLTYNFARKGGYRRGGEDYRWAELRRRMSPALFQLFNIGFIAGYQSLLIYLFTLPAAAIAMGSRAPLGALDVILALAFLAALVGETIADQQQWRFHQHKQQLVASGQVVALPFLTTGLFRYSRHPNFFFEQLQWWIFSALPIAAGMSWLGVNSLGVVLLTLLFHGSANFTESITYRKYPSYVDYQRTTSRMIPWRPKR